MKNAGIYLLTIKLAEPRNMKIGKLGTFFFKSGYYVYVGSAQKNLAQRIKRHKKRKKKLKWHIDYLLRYGRIRGVRTLELERPFECALSQRLLEIKGTEIPVQGFGASDCRCETHLVFVRKPRKIRIYGVTLFNGINEVQALV